MATEVENNVPAAETKEIKEEVVAENKEKAEEAAKQENAAGDAPPAKEAAPPKVVVHKTNYEKDVVYLYQFSRTPLLPSLSPYCLKVETWLRLAGIKYEVSLRGCCPCRRHFSRDAVFQPPRMKFSCSIFGCISKHFGDWMLGFLFVIFSNQAMFGSLDACRGTEGGPGCRDGGGC